MRRKSVMVMENVMENEKEIAGFKNFTTTFANLVKDKEVPTMFPLVSMIISQDSKKVLTVTKACDEMYFIKQYELDGDDIAPVFEEEVKGTYIKLKDI